VRKRTWKYSGQLTNLCHGFEQFNKLFIGPNSLIQFPVILIEWESVLGDDRRIDQSVSGSCPCRLLQSPVLRYGLKTSFGPCTSFESPFGAYHPFNQFDVTGNLQFTERRLFCGFAFHGPPNTSGLDIDNGSLCPREC